MTMAVLLGASSGALHAVTGPDHVLSLGPVALRRPRAPWRIGLAWGVGHGLGTLLLVLPLFALSQLVHVPQLAAWGNRAAGAALVITALVSWGSTRRHDHGDDAPGGDRNPLLVGLLHGAAGAGGLMLVLPVLVSSSPDRIVGFLAAFLVGSTAAMALLTDVIARLGSRLAPRRVAAAQTVLTAASVALGLTWMLAG